MATAITPLANLTTSTATTTVTFSSIGQGYRDLMLVITDITASSTTTNVAITLNGDSASNYQYVFMYGDGSTAASAAYGGNRLAIAAERTFSTTSKGNVIAHLLDYSTTDKHKISISRANDASGWTLATAARWSNTAAITNFTVNNWGASSWVSGTTFALYGVSA